MQIICTANASAAILQHGIYCSSTAFLATSYCGSFGVLLYFDFICGLHYHNPQHGVNMLASTTFTGFSAAVLLSLCTTAAMQHLLQHFLQYLALYYARRLYLLLGSSLFTLWFWMLSATLLMAKFSTDSAVGSSLCCVIIERILQRIIR